MRPQTSKLKQELLKLTTLQEKVIYLQNKYKDEECYILTAGPSIKDYSSEYMKEKLEDKLVIAIKQTYNIEPSIVDFHLLNEFNYQPYTYNENQSVNIMVKLDGLKIKTPDLNADMTFFIDSKKTTRLDSLASKLNYEDYLLEKTLERPFGPGIIHEIGIFLPILLGVKTINIIGWDLGESSSNEIKRFYETNKLSKKVQKILMDISPKLYNNFYIKVLNRVNYYKYLLGDKKTILNNPGITVEEAKFIAHSTKELYLWLNNKNIKMNIISTNSMVDKCVPRVKL